MTPDHVVTEDEQHCGWCPAAGEMQAFNGQWFCDETCRDNYMADWENQQLTAPRPVDAVKPILEQILKNLNDVLGGTGTHADHARQQIGRCVHCSCGARVQGRMTGAARA